MVSACIERIRTVSALMLAAAIAGCATYQHKTETSVENLPENERPEIDVRIESRLSKLKLAGKNVFVSFKNSEKLTGVLSGIVAHNGGQTVSSMENADLIMEGQGNFLAVRQFGNRQARADIGEVFEKGGRVSSIDRNFNIVISHSVGGLSAAQATAILNVADTAGEITGFKGWFNNLVAGDPDGVCFRGCEYRQAAVIEVALKERDGTRVGESRIVAQTEHKKLWPVPLINAALDKFASSEAWTQSE